MYGKRIVLTTCICVSLIMLTFSAMNASAQHTVGVKAGDWAGYGVVSLEYASNMPGYEEPPAYMNMSWMSMEILGVNNGNVTARSTMIYKNGTEETYVMSGNVTSGAGNLSVGIIPSNLGTGDEIPANLTWYTEQPLRLSINGTVTRKYAGAHREVNYVNISQPIISHNVTLGTQNITFYWDKETGFMCEQGYSYAMSYEVNMTHYYYNMSMLWRMTATNLWPAIFTVQNGYTFNVTMMSNSSISDFNFSKSLKQISFNVTGPTSKTGYCNVSIPEGLLWGDFTVYKDGALLTKDVDYVQTYNETHYTFCINYSHTTHIIEIQGTEVIPELSSAIILPILMIATVFPVILRRRRKRI